MRRSWVGVGLVAFSLASCGTAATVTQGAPKVTQQQQQPSPPPATAAPTDGQLPATTAPPTPGVTSTPAPTAASSAAPAAQAAVYPPATHLVAVTTYGARCNGVTDDTAAIRAAISAASAGTGSEVTFPAGTCALYDNLPINGPNPISLAGTGAAQTFLVQHAATNIFEITADGVTVSDMNLDTAKYNAGPTTSGNAKPAVIYATGNNTTVRNVTAEAGSGFGMRFTGPNPCAGYSRGGTSLSNIDMTSTGTGGFAAVDVDCQSHASLSAITIHGGILALFNDENTTLTGETYTPGPLSHPCAPAWYVTGPAARITIANVVSHGGPGIVRAPTSNIVIVNQTVLGPGC